MGYQTPFERLVGFLRKRPKEQPICCLKCGLPKERWSSDECPKPGGHFWIDDPRAIAPQYVKALTARSVGGPHD